LFDYGTSDRLNCAFSPSGNGNSHVVVKNMGRIRNSYYRLTKQPALRPVSLTKRHYSQPSFAGSPNSSAQFLLASAQARP